MSKAASIVVAAIFNLFAYVAATFVVTISVFAPKTISDLIYQPRSFEEITLYEFLVFLFAAFLIAVYFSFIPVVITIGALMLLGYRNFFAYVITGGLVGLMMASFGKPPPHEGFYIASVFILSGCLGGATYWLLAVRLLDYTTAARKENDRV